MSDQLAAAAAALGLPEDLVTRSAEARASEIGATVDDVLKEWAGGEAASSPGGEAVAVSAPVEAEEPSQEAATPEPVMVVAAEAQASPPDPLPVGPYVPPVLVGTKDRPMAVLTSIVGLFMIVVMVGLVGPSLPVDPPGARSSEIAYSTAAEDGQNLYSSLGCAACHTQMVRPVIADVGLGPVTLNDTNQVLGVRRFGPDLSDIGARMTASQIEATIEGLGDHPPQSLGPQDMSALVAYLNESSSGGQS